MLCYIVPTIRNKYNRKFLFLCPIMRINFPRLVKSTVVSELILALRLYLDDSPTGQEQDESENLAAQKDERWKQAWARTFGIGNPMQVYYPDPAMNTCIYTLSEDSGYKVESRRVVDKQTYEEQLRTFVKVETKQLTSPQRARRGESHGGAKMTREKVIEIRAWAKTFTQNSQTPPWSKKAAEMHISEGTLRDIVARRTWQHIV